MDDVAQDIQPVELYWRPGNWKCLALRNMIHRWGLSLHAVNIWEDDDGAALVRSVAGGNETVPTVVVGGRRSSIRPPDSCAPYWRPMPRSSSPPCPGDFVVGRDGRVVYAFRSTNPDDRPPVDDLIAAVRRA